MLQQLLDPYMPRVYHMVQVVIFSLSYILIMLMVILSSHAAGRKHRPNVSMRKFSMGVSVLGVLLGLMANPDLHSFQFVLQAATTIVCLGYLLLNSYRMLNDGINGDHDETNDNDEGEDEP